MSSDKQNVTEVELGSPDYRVVPLNAREKALLKRSPASAHWHKVLLDLLDGVKLTSREVKRNEKYGWEQAPYEVLFEFGWERKASAEAFLTKVFFKVHLSAHGEVVIDEWNHEVRSGTKIVDCLLYLGLVGFEDHGAVCKVMSTVSVQAERKAAWCLSEANRLAKSREFQKTVHRWVRMKMREEMRRELSPLLKKYPADALVEHLSALVVEDVHDL